jgi:hypothetical protein
MSRRGALRQARDRVRGMFPDAVCPIEEHPSFLVCFDMLVLVSEWVRLPAITLRGLAQALGNPRDGGSAKWLREVHSSLLRSLGAQWKRTWIATFEAYMDEHVDDFEEAFQSDRKPMAAREESAHLDEESEPSEDESEPWAYEDEPIDKRLALLQCLLENVLVASPYVVKGVAEALEEHSKGGPKRSRSDHLHRDLVEFERRPAPKPFLDAATRVFGVTIPDPSSSSAAAPVSSSSSATTTTTTTTTASATSTSSTGEGGVSLNKPAKKKQASLLTMFQRLSSPASSAALSFETALLKQYTGMEWRVRTDNEDGCIVCCRAFARPGDSVLEGEFWKCVGFGFEHVRAIVEALQEKTTPPPASDLSASALCKAPIEVAAGQAIDLVHWWPESPREKVVWGNLLQSHVLAPHDERLAELSKRSAAARRLETQLGDFLAAGEHWEASADCSVSPSRPPRRNRKPISYAELERADWVH